MSHRHRLALLAGAGLLTGLMVGCTDDTAEQDKAPLSESADATGGVDTAVGSVPVLFGGPGPQGTRLYQVSHPSDEPSSDPEQRVAAAVRAAVTAIPRDPDLRSLWPSFVRVDAVRVEADTVQVTLAPSEVEDLPESMDADEAELALQQVVQTVGAATGEAMPVEFFIDDEPATHVLGVRLNGPVEPADELDVLSMIDLATPQHGARVSGKRLRFSGVANSPEATVEWELLRGNRSVADGTVTAEGWMDARYPFRGAVRVGKLPRGRYTFVVRTSDPSGGEGFGPSEDTAQVRLR